MIKLYVILARYANGALILPEFSEEFIFTDKDDAQKAFTGLTNIPDGVVELTLNEFIGNLEMGMRKAPFPIVNHK